MKVGGKLAWELKGGRGKVGKESSSGYWHGKKSFVLLNLLSTATYFYKDPHTQSVKICGNLYFTAHRKIWPTVSPDGKAVALAHQFWGQPDWLQAPGRRMTNRRNMCSFSPLAKCQLPSSCLSHEVSVFLEPEVAHDEEASLGVCYKLLGKNICTSMINLLPPS